MMESILKSSKTVMKTRPFLMKTKRHPFLIWGCSLLYFGPSAIIRKEATDSKV